MIDVAAEQSLERGAVNQLRACGLVGHSKGVAADRRRSLETLTGSASAGGRHGFSIRTIAGTACVALALMTSALAACVVPPVPRRILFFWGGSPVSGSVSLAACASNPLFRHIRCGTSSPHRGQQAAISIQPNRCS